MKTKILSRREKEEKVKELYEQGYTYREIAKMLRISIRDISRILKEEKRDEMGEIKERISEIESRIDRIEKQMNDFFEDDAKWVEWVNEEIMKINKEIERINSNLHVLRLDSKANYNLLERTNRRLGELYEWVGNLEEQIKKIDRGLRGLYEWVLNEEEKKFEKS